MFQDFLRAVELLRAAILAVLAPGQFPGRRILRRPGPGPSLRASRRVTRRLLSRARGGIQPPQTARVATSSTATTSARPLFQAASAR